MHIIDFCVEHFTFYKLIIYYHTKIKMGELKSTKAIAIIN